MSTDTIHWGFKAVKPFDAEHPVGSGTMVHYNPGDEVPASEWGRAEGFMVEAGTIMRYALNVAQFPEQIASIKAAQGTAMENVSIPEAPPGETTPEEAPEIEADPDATYPIKKGAWYLLSNGEKIRGKAAALAAQAELDLAAEAASEPEEGEVNETETPDEDGPVVPTDPDEPTIDVDAPDPEDDDDETEEEYENE